MFRIDYQKKIRKDADENILRSIKILEAGAKVEYALGILTAYMAIFRTILKRNATVPFIILDSTATNIPEEYWKDIYILKKLSKEMHYKKQRIPELAFQIWYSTFITLLFSEYIEQGIEIWDVIKSRAADARTWIKSQKSNTIVIMAETTYSGHDDLLNDLQLRFGELSWDEVENELNYYPAFLTRYNLSSQSMSGLNEKEEKLTGELILASRNKNDIKCKQIGEQLNREGGLDRMKKVCYQVGDQGGDTRWIEMNWHGIGQWLG